MPIKILVVDDEPNLAVLMRQIFRKKIKQNEFIFIFAQNGVEALKKAEADPDIHIILTDIKMPKMDGLTLLKELQQRHPSHKPILATVIMSAYDDMENIREAMNRGAFDFLPKPIDPPDLRITLDKTIAYVSRLKEALKQQRAAQEILHQANEALEQRVEERTAELSKANTILKMSNAELDAFAHTVAHDLKSPAGLIIGYVDYLTADAAHIEPETMLEILSVIRQTGQKMGSIINELLLLASVRQEEIHTIPLNMADIISQVQQRLTPMINQYQAEIQFPSVWPVAKGYAPWIEEVWVNYLTNGLKYGGQPPRLELGTTAQAGDMVRFWVRDNGPGLSLEAQQKLFTHFTRFHKTRAEGHGLGLSIVQRILDKLGGEVGVESSPDQGSTFYFILPGVID